MKTIRRIIGIGLVIAVVFALGQAITIAAPTKKQRSFQTLRTSDPQLRQAIEQGLARSWTLRQLESHLERSSVIVYMARASLARGIVGRTRLIGAGDGWRFLSIEFDPRMEGLDLLTVIGHELQHAVEIADAANVVDDESMLELYRRIGMPAAESDLLTHSFETRLAVETGRRVHTELIGLI
jgi:hypothetical protein